MRTPNLAHEESLYLFTLKAYRTVVTLAHSDCRLLNSHLRRHALRVLEHVAASRRARGPRSRNRSLDYAKLSLAKLSAVVDAIWCEHERAEEPRERVHGLLRRLELELDGASTEISTPPDSSAKPDQPESSPAPSGTDNRSDPPSPAVPEPASDAALQRGQNPLESSPADAPPGPLDSTARGEPTRNGSGSDPA